MDGWVFDLFGKGSEPFFPTDYFPDYFRDEDSKLDIQSIKKKQNSLCLSLGRMNSLEKEYGEAIKEEDTSGLAYIYEKCELAKSILKAETDNLEYSKQRSSGNSNLVLCYISLIVSIMALLWSSGLAWEWIQKVAQNTAQYIDKQIEENPELLNPSINDQIVAVTFSVALILLFTWIIADIVDYLRWNEKLRAKYKNAYQCFDIMQSAVLSIMKERTERA